MNNTYDELKDIFNNVINEYNIKPYNIKVIQNEGLKTLWKFDYDSKSMCLKRFRHTKEKIIFSVNAQRYIKENGGLVPYVYSNKAGQHITEYMGQLFVMYEWINGRDLNFTRSSDFKYGIEGLALFHKASKGYKAPEGAKISSKLGRWPEQYGSMRKRMLKWKDIANSKVSNNSYKVYLEYIDDIINLCDKALDVLESSSYDKLTQVELYESSLCHQDYGSGNAILSQEEVYVIDLDGVTYDLVARDLRKIIGKRAEKRGSWDVNDINRILDYYERNNKLTLEDKKMLKADLMFPHWFFGTIKNIFSKNKLVNPGKIAKIAKLEKEKIKVLDKWIIK
ncbi:spore coat protein I [Vallitalea longa]|uniref:Spore coat protein I n=1 Tax=Vallitalea longa TaxID=2936439 RepID=A0A9W5YEL2_9FIRM|nr:CotS family spore coat protein [Vallitalea longa]GKX31256.1 spore coat protein I [Vallitalea longa]